MSHQAAIQQSTEARLLRRTCESLIGICAGLVADGELNDREVLYLSTWLADNAAVSNTWPAEVVLARVREVLLDGHVSNDERQYLLDTLNDVVGGSFSDTGSVSGAPTALPLEAGVLVVLANRSLCFTGQFLFGTRSACERASISRGAACLSTVTKKLDYLVIGEMASRDWKNTTHGTKIENAIEVRKQGGRLRIVSEAQWIMSLTETNIGLTSSGGGP